MCRPQPLGLATGPQLHRHEFRLQLEQPVTRKSLDPVHRTLPSRKPDPSLWKHALPVRFWKYSGEDDWQGISPNGLLCWRVHFVPSATRPWNLPSRYWDAGCLGSHLHTCGMCDADEPAEVLISLYGSSGSRCNILLRLQSNHRYYSGTCFRVGLRSKHCIHSSYHWIHGGNTLWNRLGPTLEKKPHSHPRTLRHLPCDTRITCDVLWAKRSPRRTLAVAPRAAGALGKPVWSHPNRQDSDPVSTTTPSCLLQELEHTDAGRRDPSDPSFDLSGRNRKHGRDR